MESLRDLDNGVMALCGGMCSCATCHCYIEEPWASSLLPREDDELELLEDLESFREDQSRLTCQIDFTEDMDGIRLEIAPEDQRDNFVPGKITQLIQLKKFQNSFRGSTNHSLVILNHDWTLN